MSLKGDYAKLQTMRKRIEHAKSPAVRLELSTKLAATARAQLNLGFRGSVDPYGSAWAKLKRRRGKPLLDTGRLRNSYSTRAHEDGFQIGTNVVYAKFHQQGTKGRGTASGRFQAVDHRGRFLSRKKAGVKKGKSAVFLWHGVRRLEFTAGGGKIPARMMLPTKARGLGKWEPPMRATANRFLARVLRG